MYLSVVETAIEVQVTVLYANSWYGSTKRFGKHAIPSSGWNF